MLLKCILDIVKLFTNFKVLLVKIVELFEHLKVVIKVP